MLAREAEGMPRASMEPLSLFLQVERMGKGRHIAMAFLREPPGSRWFFYTGKRYHETTIERAKAANDHYC